MRIVPIVAFLSAALTIAACTPDENQVIEANEVTLQSLVFDAPTQCETFDEGCYNSCYNERKNDFKRRRQEADACLARCIDPNDPDGTFPDCTLECPDVDLNELDDARVECERQCTSVEPPSCGQCVESFESATTICTREVPENIIVTTIIRVNCGEQAQQWEARGWQCGACIAPHPIAKEFQYKACGCNDTRWLEACAEQPIFSGDLP